MPDWCIRVMKESDLADADRLRQQAGWNQLPSDWLRLLRYQPDGCFVAVASGTVVGTVTSTTYANRLAWIGMMLVDPRFQRQGIASALMTQAVEYLTESGVACIKLDATPVGEAVYKRLGFQSEWSFNRWHRSAGSEPTATKGDQLLELTEYNEFDPGRLDEVAFGVCRKRWLRALCPAGRVVSCEAGFGMLRPGQVAGYLGPVTAVSVTDASAIIGDLLRGESTDVFWDIPGPNAAAAELATKLTFEPVRGLTRMWTGRELIPADVSLQYALADPGTG